MVVAPNMPMTSGGTAVMAWRREPVDSLDFFPTPPWATRALCEHVLGLTGDEADRKLTAWEPAAGEGHMAEVLREYFGSVQTSDVHDYGKGYQVGSFVGAGPDVARHIVDWIITNPPFNLALDFALRGLELSLGGVALLTRTAWLEGGDRFTRLFSLRPPATVALFSERVPMVKGHWDPRASSATSYAWIVWEHGHRGDTRLTWIPPGQRKALTRPDDVARFAP
jgi:hypothetical protein